jgi:hypothetical protein
MLDYDGKKYGHQRSWQQGQKKNGRLPSSLFGLPTSLFGIFCLPVLMLMTERNFFSSSF